MSDNVIEQVCSEIEGLKVPEVPEQMGVATFANEASICAVDPIEDSNIGFASVTTEGQDLKEYFRRPRLIRGGFAGTTTSTLYVADVNVQQLFDVWFPLGRDRLEGVAGVRFNQVYTLTVAANPFHGGTLALAFQHASSFTDANQFCRLNYAPSSTSLPHVRLNLAEETMVQLTVPYIWDRDYMPLTSTNQDLAVLGAVGITQIVPTPALTNSPPPGWKLYVHLEDMELLGSRPLNEQIITAQSGLRTSEVGSSRSIVQEMKANKLLSRGLSAASSMVTNIGAAVPSLLPISGPTSWALRMAAGVASVFGYAKPRDSTQLARIYRSDYIGEMNVDMPSAAYSLAATAEASLRVDPTMSGSSVDEMSLRFVTSKYSQICLTDITTADSTGTRLWGTTTCLLNFWYRSGNTKPFCNLDPPSSSNTANAIYPSGLMYWSDCFRGWRGTLKFRFTFGKSKLHAGRVIVGFVPAPLQRVRNGVNSRVIPALEVTGTFPQPFSYSMVCDLKDSSVFEFEVPYVSPYLWTYTGGYTGGVTMTVLDPLIANGEVSTTVPILVEVAGGDDFEFAGPTTTGMVPVSGNNNLNIYSQSGVIANNRRVEEYTTGETIQSLKQLLMIPSSVVYDVANLSENTTSLPTFAYLPQWLNAIPMANPSTAYFATSRQSRIAACYAYFYGGTSYDVYCDAENDNYAMQALQQPEQGGFVSTAKYGPYYAGTPNNAIRITTSKNALHFQVPSAGYTPRIATRIQYVFPNPNRNFIPGLAALYNSGLSLVSNLRVRNTTGRSIRVNLSYAGADDARMGTYIGPPLVYLFNPAQTVSPDLGLSGV
jgi:hypothetical protein